MKIENMEHEPVAQGQSPLLPPDALAGHNDTGALEALFYGTPQEQASAEEWQIKVAGIPLPIVDVSGQLVERVDDPEVVEALQRAYIRLEAHETALKGTETITVRGEDGTEKKISVPTLRDFVVDESEAFPLAAYIRQDGHLALYDTANPGIGGAQVRGVEVEITAETPSSEIEHGVSEIKGKPLGKGRDSSMPPPAR